MTTPKLLVFAHDASLYGASKSLLTLLEEISASKSADLLVLLPHKGKMEDILLAKEINYKVLSFPRCFTYQRLGSGFSRLKSIISYRMKVYSSLPELISIAMQYKPNIIYSNTSVISIGFVLAEKLKLPHVWHIREYGDLDYNFNYLPTRRYVSNQIKRSQNVIFVSRHLQQHWLGSASKKKSYVIYNGLVADNVSFPEKTFPDNAFRLGILGAIIPGKGQHIAIKAIGLLSKKYPKLKLYLYGNIIDTAYYESLKRIISQYDCSANIEFKKFEDNQDLIYRNLDVLLNCSLMEGFGRTIVEAMYRGIPVIANASGGPLEIITHNKNGFLYDHSPESLSQYIEALIHDRKLYTEISAGGRVHALNYSISSYVNNVCKVLNIPYQHV